MSFRKLLKVLPVLGLVFAASNGFAAVVNIEADEILKLRKSEPAKVLILDVRTPGEFAEGRIPGSVLVPMRDVPSKLGSIGKDKKIVVVCASGSRSGAVADYLSKNGYPWVRNYGGGMFDWQRRGLPVER